MPVNPLANKLVICITSTALFDCSESHAIYKKDGLDAYIKHQSDNESVPLERGVGFALVQNFLNLNKVTKEDLVEVVVTSRNDCESGQRLNMSLEHWKLQSTRYCLTNGTSVVRYLEPWGCDLFLSTSDDDVRDALFGGFPAALVGSSVSFDYQQLTRSVSEQERSSAYSVESYVVRKVADRWPNHQARIAFDGDGVLFSDQAECVYQEFGLEAFQKFEHENHGVPLPAGTFKKIAVKLQEIRDKLADQDKDLIRTFFVTSRNDKARFRAVNTLKDWGLKVDEAFLLGGLDKTPFLRVIDPAVFFDDQREHIDRAQPHIPSAHVPFGVKNTSERPGFAVVGVGNVQ